MDPKWKCYDQDSIMRRIKIRTQMEVCLLEQYGYDSFPRENIRYTAI